MYSAAVCKPDLTNFVDRLGTRNGVISDLIMINIERVNAFFKEVGVSNFEFRFLR